MDVFRKHDRRRPLIGERKREKKAGSKREGPLSPSPPGSDEPASMTVSGRPVVLGSLPDIPRAGKCDVDRKYGQRTRQAHQHYRPRCPQDPR